MTAKSLLKQGVTLTGRNTTGPPSRAAPGELRCICAGVTDNDDRRRQSPATVTSLAPYTMADFAPGAATRRNIRRLDPP